MKKIFILLFFPLILFSQVDFQSSNLPIIIIETNNKEIVDDPRIIADMKIINNSYPLRNYITDFPNNYDGNISIEIRGGTSQTFPKKQYGFETQLIDGSNNNVSLLNLPSENDWILSAPYSDKTLIRNIIAYELSKKMGHYAPRTKFCELVINDEYQGIYVLTEKIKRDKNRINISNLNSNDISGDDLTGGYILKIDRLSGSNTCEIFPTKFADVWIQIDYPKCDNIIDEQKSYINNYINSFEEVLYSDFFSDSIFGYRSFLDLNSVIDYLIINELSNNVDAYNLSTYLYKDKNSKGGELVFGPVWDYNLAFGNVNYNNKYRIDGFEASDHIWYKRFLQDSIFIDKLKNRWFKLRLNELSNDSIIKMIDSLTNFLNESQKRNFQKWKVLSTPLWPNYFIGNSYSSEIEFLKSWIIARLIWLDNYFLSKTNIEQIYFSNNINIFPIPFTYFLTIVFNLSESSNISINLLNIHGNVIDRIIDNVYYKEGNHSFTYHSFVNNELVPNQFYLINFLVDGRLVFTKKIINKF